MPLVNKITGLPVLAPFSGHTKFTAYPTPSLKAAFNGKTTVTAGMPSGGYPLTVFNGSTTITANYGFVLSDDPIVFNGTTTIAAAYALIRHDDYELRFAVNVLKPNTATVGEYHKVWIPRLKVDGVEVLIVSAEYTESQTSAGAELNVRLVDPANRSLFTSDAEIEFGIGEKNSSDAWVSSSFSTIFSTGNAQSREHSIGWQNGGPTDAVAITVDGDVSKKLLTTPSADCVIYDSAKQTLSSTDFDILYDTEGRAYPTELKAIPQMTLYDLLYEVFVTRCGFGAYKTNLPDYPVARVDIGMGQGYLESIRGVMGMFSPVIFTDGNTIWIVDASIALPSGFPAARSIAISNYSGLSYNDTEKHLDALIVGYTQEKRTFDYITTRVETETSSTGTFGQPGYSNTFIEKGYREYRRFAQPAVILREELYYEKHTVSGSFTDISETNETYVFDEIGRVTSRSKTIEQVIPPITGGTAVLTLVSEESEAFSYAAHPYHPKSQYIARRETNISGLIATDSDNKQLGNDYERDYLTSYRNGNLASGQTTRSGPIKTYIETAIPKRDGQVTVKTMEIDHLSNTVINDTREDRSGDIAIYGTQPQQGRVLVLDDENALRNTDRVEAFSVGELPLSQGIPLARRRLKRLKTKAKQGSVEWIGYDPALKKGLPVALTGRGGEALGNYLIVGRSIRAGRDGASTRLEVIQI